MTDRPIIFSAPMVRALLDGRKSQTRRVLKPQPFPVGGPFYRPFEKTDPCLWYSVSAAGTVANIQKVPYAPGDRLYVREAFAKVGDIDDDIHACPDLRIHAYYRADAVDPERQRWRSPIHMPRWASRITLTVTEVRVQRLQEISEADAVAEGISAVTRRFPPFQGCPQQLRERTIYEWTGGWSVRATDAYRALWNSLHGPDAWDANPWVVAINFTTRKGNIDTPSAESASAARGEEG